MDHIYMVGGGTGITPLYQIIQYVTEAEKASDRPALTLLFANRTEDDILVKPELDTFQNENGTFRCFYSVDRSVKEGWKGFVGYIDEEKISKIVAEGSLDNSLFVVCGPPVLCNIVEKVMTTKFKARPEQFFRF